MTDSRGVSEKIISVIPQLETGESADLAHSGDPSRCDRDLFLTCSSQGCHPLRAPASVPRPAGRQHPLTDSRGRLTPRKGLPSMAKAILGHVGGPDPRLMAEVARLRRRVAELDAEVTRLNAENQALLTQSLDGSLDDSLVAAMPGPSESLAEEIITLDSPSPDRSAPAMA